VPASLIGSRQVIEVGPMSGESNVVCWLEDHGIAAEPVLVEEIFRRAKQAAKVLTDAEILEICAAVQAPGGPARTGTAAVAEETPGAAAPAAPLRMS
jgi:isopropylmalate/homocitrate/citramalate synthase